MEGNRRRWTAYAAVLLTLSALVAGTAVATGTAHAATTTHGTAARATAAKTWWAPPLGVKRWQWELTSPLDLANPKQMGTNDLLANGRPAPAPVIYDIDGIINPASTVAALHSLGKRVVCYVEVGAAGNYYSATDEGMAATYYAQFRAAGVLGSAVRGWPERYLDIRSPSAVAIVESMIAQQCAAKGFDAVETDIDESYASANGFGLTRADEERFMTSLAHFMHRLGLGWWIKNPDDTGDGYATDMFPLADAVLTEQCNQYSTCSALGAYVGKKAVFDAEYVLPPDRFCAQDATLGFNGAKFNLGLTGVRKPCN